MPTDAEEFFNEIFIRRSIEDWTTIQSFRHVTRSGVPASRMVLAEEHRRTIRSFVEDPCNASLFTGTPSHGEESIAMLADKIIENGIASTEASVDSASVIFAHSILDGTAYDCCMVTAKIAPKDWERELPARRGTSPKSKISRMRISSAANLKNKFVKGINRDSLPNKIKHLFVVCRWPSGWSPMRDYAFDPHRIKAFDDLRHDIIHGTGAHSVAGLDEKLFYLQQTTFFLLGLVTKRFSVRFDPAYPARRPPRRLFSDS